LLRSQRRQQDTHTDNAIVMVDSVGVIVNALAVTVVVAVLHEACQPSASFIV